MRTGILGSGLMGGKLGTLFARAGHEVVFSYARTRKKLEDLAGNAGAKARAGTPSEAARASDAEAKRTAARLIVDVGFEPLDAGPLRIARYTEPFALLGARLAYEGEGGPQLAYRFEHLGNDKAPARRNASPHRGRTEGRRPAKS